MKINEQWQLTGGLRYDHYHTSYSATALARCRRVPITPTDLSTSGDLWSGKLGVVYKPAENGSIYAAWGTSAQPRAAPTSRWPPAAPATAPSRVDFQPQEATTYEVGTKWDVLNKRLALTARALPHRGQERSGAGPHHAAVLPRSARSAWTASSWAPPAC